MGGDDDAVTLWNVQNVTALTDAGGEADDDALPSDNRKLGVFTYATISPSEGLWCVSVCKGLLNVELVTDVLESLGLEFKALI